VPLDGSVIGRAGSTVTLKRKAGRREGKPDIRKGKNKIRKQRKRVRNKKPSQEKRAVCWDGE